MHKPKLNYRPIQLFSNIIKAHNPFLRKMFYYVIQEFLYAEFLKNGPILHKKTFWGHAQTTWTEF